MGSSITEPEAGSDTASQKAIMDLERILNEEESLRGSVKAAVNRGLAMLELKEKMKRLEMKLGEES